MRGIGWEYVHVAVDDATRVTYVEVLSDEQRVTVTAFLWRALAWFRRVGIRVRRILTDNGSGYRSHVFAQLCQAGAKARAGRPVSSQVRSVHSSALDSPEPAKRPA